MSASPPPPPPLPTEDLSPVPLSTTPLPFKTKIKISVIQLALLQERNGSWKLDETLAFNLGLNTEVFTQMTTSLEAIAQRPLTDTEKSVVATHLVLDVVNNELTKDQQKRQLKSKINKLDAKLMAARAGESQGGNTEEEEDESSPSNLSIEGQPLLAQSVSTQKKNPPTK